MKTEAQHTDTAKAVLLGKFVVVNIHIKKKEFSSKQLQVKPERIRRINQVQAHRTETIKILTEINKIGPSNLNRINEAKSRLFKNINETDKRN